MHAKLLVVAFAAALSAANCSSKTGGSIVQPSPLPIPDQSRFEPLGMAAAPKHYLKDSAGKDTDMWARLIDVSPTRGLAVPLRVPNCISEASKCFKYSGEVGMDADREQEYSSVISFYWSKDCVNREGSSLGGARPKPGESAMAGAGIVFSFEFAPKCLIAHGEHFQTKFPGVVMVGDTSFMLEYEVVQSQANLLWRELELFSRSSLRPRRHQAL